VIPVDEMLAKILAARPILNHERSTTMIVAQTLCVLEEVGEFLNEMESRLPVVTGDRDAVSLELADIVISAYLLAASLGTAIGTPTAAPYDHGDLPEFAGRLAGTVRRYVGYARRVGTIQEVQHALTDLLAATAGAARWLRIDLDEAIAAKVAVIMGRPFAEETK